MPDNFGADDYLTFNEDLHFRLAVGAKFKGENTLKKYDSKIVKWMARVTSKDEKGESTKTLFPMHDCSEQDFNEFNPL